MAGGGGGGVKLFRLYLPNALLCPSLGTVARPWQPPGPPVPMGLAPSSAPHSHQPGGPLYQHGSCHDLLLQGGHYTPHINS